MPDLLNPSLTPRDAEPATLAAQRAVLDALPFDRDDAAEDAWRGFIAPLPGGRIAGGPGGTVLDLGLYDFLSREEAPPTVNPSLWRIARLNMAGGLFKVTEGVYQIRGIDIAVMTIIEGETGLIVVDTMQSMEAASAGLALYRAHRPDRPVVAVIYTHSHTDHYGGALGVTTFAEVASGKVRVIAPDGFMEALGAETILAGIPVVRRSQYQFGNGLPKGPRGQVDGGLGKQAGGGTTTLIAPTQLIAEPIETHIVDGVEIVFQLAPDTEAPAEMHLFLPKSGVLNMAENVTHHLHNFIPMRGTTARDTRIWSHYIAAAMELFGDRVEILIGQHHWPTWGRERILAFLARQRDLYKYIHDQTLRLASHGLGPADIAERLRLPPGLENDWSCRGYYGTVSHNAKAVYQRYLSWYDCNPANLNPLPAIEAGRKAVEYMGGAAVVIARAREDFARGEYRWVAQVMNQLVFAEPENAEARALAADALEQLGYQAEAATWRNAYLLGAQELRHGVAKRPPVTIPRPGLLTALSTQVVFDYMAVRLNPEKAGGTRLFSTWHFPDTGETAALTLENATLTVLMGRAHRHAEATITLARPGLDRIIGGQDRFTALLAAGEVKVEGEAAAFEALFDMLDTFQPMFDIVTPPRH